MATVVNLGKDLECGEMGFIHGEIAAVGVDECIALVVNLGDSDGSGLGSGHLAVGHSAFGESESAVCAALGNCCTIQIVDNEDILLARNNLSGGSISHTGGNFWELRESPHPQCRL